MTNTLLGNSMNILLENKNKFKIDLPQTIDKECAFILGVRKSGSTLLNKIILDLCYYNKFPTYSIADRAFEQNLLFAEWQNNQELNEIIQDGIFYIGFRSLPQFLLQNSLFKKRKKIFLVRDPRDSIVSEYFSVAYSHSLPKVENSNTGGAREDILRRRKESKFQEIDEYVLKNAPAMNRTIMEYIKALKFDDPKLQLYRYEDIITNKQFWIEEMARFLELELPKSLLDNILDRLDIIPSKETSNNFVRKALPGDHKEKLTTKTIDELNGIFSEILNEFDYQ